MKDWLTYLIDKDGNSLVKRDGLVTSVPQPVPTRYTPAGWEEIAILWERSFTGDELGVLRNTSTPLEFHHDSADILREYLYHRSIEEKVFLLLGRRVLEINDQQYWWRSKFFYKGELDTTTLKHAGSAVTATIAEGGLAAQYKAGKGTVQEVPLEDGEAILVKMDGMYLYQKHNWLQLDFDTVLTNADFIVPVAHTTSEGTAYGLAATDQSFETIAIGSYDFANSTNYFSAAGQALQGIHITGTLTWGISGWVRLQVINQNRQVLATLLDKANTTEVIHIVDTTFDAAAGDKLFLVVDVSGGSVHARESQLSINYKSRYRTTYVRAFQPMTALSRLTGKLTGDSTKAASTLLPTSSRYALTSGDGLRGLKGAVLKTSLDEFREFCRVVLAASLGIEGERLVVEAYEHFLSTDNPIMLGRVKNLTVERARDMLCNVLKVGYRDRSIDDVNGRYAFCGTHVYSSATTRVTKECTMVSPYYADPYLIELLRIQTEGKESTDTAKDNDIFILDTVPPEPFTASAEAFEFGSTIGNGFGFPDTAHLQDMPVGCRFSLSGTALNDGLYTVTNTYVQADGKLQVWVKEDVQVESFQNATFMTNVHTLRRDPALTVSGVPDPGTVFNVELSPKRLAYRQLRWLSALFEGTLTFTSTEKNREVATVHTDGTVVDEDANLTVAANPLFLPLRLDFDTEVPSDLVETLSGSVNRAFCLQWNGVLYTGFTERAGLAPSNDKEQSYKLISTPINDFTKLRING